MSTMYPFRINRWSAVDKSSFCGSNLPKGAKQIDTLTKEIEEKTARVGDDGVKLSEMKWDLENTAESLECNSASRMG